MSPNPKTSGPETPVPGRRWSWLILGVALLVAAALVFTTRAPAQDEETESVSTEVLELGETIYSANCAACHGAEGEGYASVQNAPALNGSEHAWHHPDEQIISLIREGGMQMPAVGADWSDEEIEAVLSYVKAWWTPQQRNAQAGTIGE